MVWQDIVFSISTLVFAYALIPQIYHNWKKQKGSITAQTSLLTALGMYAITIAYFTLNLFLSTIIGFATASLWLILFIQKLAYD